VAHLWRHVEAVGWQPVALPGDSYALTTRAPRLSPAEVPGVPTVVAHLRRGGASVAADDSWVLLTAPAAGVLVNGLGAALGIIVLIDRDEIRVPSESPLYFSTERLAVAVPYPAALQGVCPRCRTSLEAGTIAVLCPACGLWHHASDDLPCWTYADTCAACTHPTALDTGFCWTPGEL
jgi:hypothetical protein